MKKILISLMTVFLLFIIAGCSKVQNLSEPLGEPISITFGELKLTLPAVFEKDPENSDEYILFYNDIESGCDISISKSPYISNDLYETVKSGLLSPDSFDYSTKNINGNNWAFGFANMEWSAYSYAINYNNNLYAIDYTTYGTNNSTCQKYLNEIEQSLKF